MCGMYRKKPKGFNRFRNGERIKGSSQDQMVIGKEDEKYVLDK